MRGFELYVFFLCLFVFISLTALFSCMIIYIARLKATIITNGLEDGKIKEKLTKKLNSRATKFNAIMEKAGTVFSMLFCALLCLFLIFTSVFSCNGDGVVETMSAIKVVASTSMSAKYENNKYLFENSLNDQLQMFDVVLLHKLPKEEDIQLYDIVVYEHISGALLIHRIVGIEEPNDTHPDERYFILQGDAVHYPDTFPVRYSQMRSIYRGERVPNIGSFVFFIQSPAGIMCIILMVVAMFLMPIADNYLLKKEYARAVTMVKNKELHPLALEYYKEILRIKDNDNSINIIDYYGDTEE